MDRKRPRRWMGAGVGLLILLIVPLSALGTNGANPDGTIDFVAVNAEVTKLLFLFADYGRINIIVDPNVSGTVTVRLSHVQPAVAFEIVMELAGLEAYDVDGSLFITKKSALNR